MATKCTNVKSAVSRIVDGPGPDDTTLRRVALARKLATAGAIQATSITNETTEQLERYHSPPDVTACGVKVACPEQGARGSRSRWCSAPATQICSKASPTATATHVHPCPGAGMRTQCQAQKRDAAMLLYTRPVANACFVTPAARTKS
jgi:hypothetical protein